jgi:hypothetical protein
MIEEVAAVARRPYWREADGRVVIEAWRRSDEPLATFARRHGLHPRRIARWTSKIKHSESSAVRFHAVHVATSQSAAPIEIQLDDGWRVRVHRDFDAEDLRRVLAVLGEKTTC